MRPFSEYEVRLRLERKRPVDPVRLESPRGIYEFMSALRDEPSEWMYELLLDTKHRLQGVYLVGKGGVDNCSVHPLEVYKAAIISNSPAFALVHNHPSGVVDPSLDDMALVTHIAEGARTLELNFSDFMIIGDTRYYSFHEAGRMPTRGK